MIDLHYFGNIHYYILLSKNINSPFSTNHYFTKGWFNNKTVVIGSNGLINLTVPIEGGRNKKQVLKDVKIAYNEPWQNHHLKVLKSCYGNAPFFESYFFYVEKLYSKKFEYLIDANFESNELVNKLLKLNLKLELCKDENINSLNLISSKNSTLNSEYSSHYIQLFEDKIGHQTNPSILDLIFNEGPNSKKLLFK